MQKETKTERLKRDSVVFDFIKGGVVALIISLALVILFAFCFKWFSLPDGIIAPITFVIKGLSVLFGALIAVKGSRGLIKGVLFGVTYYALSYVIFSILAGSFSFALTSLLDLAFSAILGGIVGIIKVNRK